MIFLDRMADIKKALQLRHCISHPTGPRQQLTHTEATEHAVSGAVCGAFEA